MPVTAKPKLTKKAFFEALGERAKKYGFWARKSVEEDAGADLIIREKKTFCCPVVAVARQLGVRGCDNVDHEKAAERIGLEFDFAQAVADASDDEQGCDQSLIRLRRRILKTVGIDPKAVSKGGTT